MTRRKVRHHVKRLGVALLDGSLGTALVHAHSALKHASKRKNPPLPVRQFGSARGHLVSRQVLAVRYRNVGSVQRTPYEHRFDSAAEMWALADGSLLIRGARGQRLWDDFFVRDGE